MGIPNLSDYDLIPLASEYFFKERAENLARENRSIALIFFHSHWTGVYTKGLGK